MVRSWFAAVQIRKTHQCNTDSLAYCQHGENKNNTLYVERKTSHHDDLHTTCAVTNKRRLCRITHNSIDRSIDRRTKLYPPLSSKVHFHASTTLSSIESSLCWGNIFHAHFVWARFVLAGTLLVFPHRRQVVVAHLVWVDGTDDAGTVYPVLACHLSRRALVGERCATPKKWMIHHFNRSMQKNDGVVNIHGWRPQLACTGNKHTGRVSRTTTSLLPYLH
jgi:hypothetical protein